MKGKIASKDRSARLATRYSYLRQQRASRRENEHCILRTTSGAPPFTLPGTWLVIQLSVGERVCARLPYVPASPSPLESNVSKETPSIAWYLTKLNLKHSPDGWLVSLRAVQTHPFHSIPSRRAGYFYLQCPCFVNAMKKLGWKDSVAVGHAVSCRARVLGVSVIRSESSRCLAYGSVQPPRC
jgi:hypothetical protein